ncbi:MAG: antibiotic biosynthesis monooxygenase [Paraglaciecola sp.]|nr:antibiotic biosynthesis monooxygenase [Paraglaciecola sp.]NCT47585.1 antibiotic biosynthesis monooxygenase [Paraglaciecola sp.]
MIIVSGDIVAKPECRSAALAASLKHVQHSEGEEGCISHAVYQDVTNPLRLFFFEQWQDQQALDKHFKHASSLAFIASLDGLLSAAPNLHIYAAQQLR